MEVTSDSLSGPSLIQSAASIDFGFVTVGRNLLYEASPSTVFAPSCMLSDEVPDNSIQVAMDTPNLSFYVDRGLCDGMFQIFLSGSGGWPKFVLTAR